jgi:hypothetical protein
MSSFSARTIESPNNKMLFRFCSKLFNIRRSLERWNTRKYLAAKRSLIKLKLKLNFFVMTMKFYLFFSFFATSCIGLEIEMVQRLLDSIDELVLVLPNYSVLHYLFDSLLHHAFIVIHLDQRLWCFCSCAWVIETFQTILRFTVVNDENIFWLKERFW